MKDGNSWYRRRREKLVQEYGGECERCRSKERLEFAHLMNTPLSGRGRGYNNRVLDVIRYPECYILLCNVCHRQMDNQTIRVEYPTEGVRA